MLELGAVEPPVEIGEVAEWVKALNFVELTAADNACRAYSEYAEWPVELENDVKAQIHLRIEAGIHVCHCASRGAFAGIGKGDQKGRPPYGSERLALDSMLCDMWAMGGLEVMMDRYAVGSVDS